MGNAFLMNHKIKKRKKVPISYYVNTFQTNPSLAKNYRCLAINIDSSSLATRIVSSGYDSSLSVNGSNSSTFWIPTSYPTTKFVYSPYFNWNSSNTVINSEVLDASDNVINKLTLKTTSQYNYIIVDDSYVILFEVKGKSGSFTIPEKIENLPVLDVGCIFYDGTNTSYNTYNVEHLILPSTVQCGSRFANLNIKMKSLTIQNPEFIWYGDYGLNNNNGTFVIYAPNNSSIYKRLVSSGRNVQPL